jgi:hypothetical protein
MSNAIKSFYPAIQANSPFNTNFSTAGFIDPRVFVRLIWVQTHTDEQFDKTQRVHIDELVEIYSLYHVNWRKDEYIVSYFQTYGLSPGLTW